MNDCANRTPRDQRNLRRYTWLLALWALIYLGATLLVRGDLAAESLRWLVAITPSIFAAVAVAAYWHYLREADELARAIELKALALAVVTGFIVWPATALLNKAGLGMEIGSEVTVVAMAALYTFGVIKGWREYR